MGAEWRLNDRAAACLQPLIDEPARFRVAVKQVAESLVIDGGVTAPGGLEAGRILAETCLAGMGRVTIQASEQPEMRPLVCVSTDQPLAACMASQYAGWQVSADDYFAMGSGPMRTAAAREALFQEPLFQSFAEERPEGSVVGVLESDKLPTEQVCRTISQQCGVPADRLLLMVAPTASLAGSIQVVARSVETAMHKLHELGYPLDRIHSGFGAAPLPAVAADPLEGIGRTNDAVLYAGQVTLWVDDDDQHLQQIGPKVPSNASQDHGRPFREIFERNKGDFYAIDPALFSPAVVRFINLRTGRAFQFGEFVPLPESH